jgi:CubicO group peptidase (beta-lactamase class C family)
MATATALLDDALEALRADAGADGPRRAAVGVVAADGTTLAAGDTTAVLPWASVSKLVTTLAVLVAVEEESVRLDDPAGPPGSTLRHLLAHASGLPFDDTSPVAPPGTRRIYSNTGIEAAAAHVAVATAFSFTDYVHEAVFAPLAMTSTTMPGSPAASASGSCDDLVRLAAELRAPTLVSPATLAEATAVQFPGLRGVVPGFGRFDPCDWGVGFELRDAKVRHWTGGRNSPPTFGHFGQSGAFVWVDPDAAAACAFVGDAAFGPWAAACWPALSDAALDVATAAVSA